jgi:hypothetical protein
MAVAKRALRTALAESAILRFILKPGRRQPAMAELLSADSKPPIRL